MQYRLLIVDDNLDNLNSTAALAERWGYDVQTTSSGDLAIEKLQEPGAEFAVVLLDYQMPEKNGAETAIEIRAFNQESVILMYSAFRDPDKILSSIRAGSVDFIEKTEDVSYLKQALENACKKFEEATRLTKNRLSESAGTELLKKMKMFCRSKVMVDVALQIQKFRASPHNVLITGETGVGKELVAKALHTGPASSFTAINCAAFTDSKILASELFGHEKGAFTGASERKVGIFESVRGGTVFLDEIHCLGRLEQNQLLRAIREKKIRRVGGTQEYPINFRLIAATKPDIEQLVEKGKFIPDLYYRLKFLTVSVPSLRERLEDIEPLVLHFCDKFFEQSKVTKTFRSRTTRLLENHNWPGNIGELEGYVMYLLTNSEKNTIEPDQLDSKFFQTSTHSEVRSLPELDKFYEQEKRKRISAAVKSSGNISQAASRLGVSRTTLHTLLTRMGMRAQLLKSE